MKKLLFLFSYCLFFYGCSWNQENYQAEVKAVMSRATSIEFMLPPSAGGSMKITHATELQMTTAWLVSASPPKAIGSYPDTLVPVHILFKNGTSFDFNISEPISPLTYSMIDWKGKRLVAGPFPFRGPKQMNELIKKSVEEIDGLSPR